MSNTGRLIAILALAFGAILVAAVFLLTSRPGPEQPAPPPPSAEGKQPETGRTADFPPIPPDREPTPPPDDRTRTPGERLGNSLGGRVVNEQGAPVAGATVTAEQGVGNLMEVLKGERPPFSATAKTNREGGYLFQALPAYENYVVTATHADYAPARLNYVSVSQEQPTEIADLVLRSGCTISGTVVDKAKAPIAGAAVTVDPSFLSPFARTSAKGSATRSVKTDAGGSFEVRNLPEGQLSLTVSAKGYGSRTIPNLLFTAESKKLVQEIVLEEGKSIFGKVVDTAGRGVANAKVEATSYASQNPCRGSGASNELGEFQVADLAEGTFVLVVTAEGYSTKRENRVTPGETVTVTLTSQGSVAGRVIAKRNGQPVRQFTLELRRPLPNGGTARLGFESRRFDSPDGRFTLPGLDPENSYVILALAPGFAPTFSQTFTVSGPEPVGGFEIAMTAGGTIVGKVVDAKTGRPLAGASLQTRENGYFDNPISQMFGTSQQDTLQVGTRSGKDGSFRLENVCPGTYQVEADMEGFTKKGVRDVIVAEEGTNDLGAISLTTGGVVTGSAFDPSGRPLAGAEVSIRSLSPGTLFTRNVLTDQSGRYTIRNLAAGEYQISVSAGNFASGNIFERIKQINETRQTILVREGIVMENVNFVVK